VERLRRLVDLPEIEQALASLPVYRTYVDARTGRITDDDRIAAAGLPEPVRSRILLETDDPPEFVTRFQQTSGAVMAKGVEDTAFYRYVRLLALNEVGGDPARFSISVAEFHAANRERQERFPYALLAGTTHDTKRSADVRARIGALSTMPERWVEHVLRWHELNKSNEGAPDWSEELLIYQTLLGTWPINPQRLKDYIQKAIHEEKRHSSWTEPNERWDMAVARFCDNLYRNKEFLADFEPFACDVARAGERAAIGQLILRLTSPGVPDIYNGDELWYLALVDPDNRRPIDWQRSADVLADIAGGGAPTRETVKLFVIYRLLGLRARHPEAFAGSYQSVDAAEGTCAYRRGTDVIVAVPRESDHPNFQQPSGRWSNQLDGLSDCLDGYAPCVLERLP
jgi:(1->4)-alpha-D-glucan 1-alpha-D-glucosylmutase